MSDHQLPANRQAVLDYIAVLLKNPELDDEQVFGSLTGLVAGLIKSVGAPFGAPASLAQRGIETLAEHAEPSVNKSKSRRSTSGSLYLKGLLPKLKDYLSPDADIDPAIGISCEEIREELFERGDIYNSTTADNIQRVLVANQRHFQRLPNGNWRPRPKAKSVDRPTKKLLESKKQSNPDAE